MALDAHEIAEIEAAVLQMEAMTRYAPRNGSVSAHQVVEIAARLRALLPREESLAEAAESAALYLETTREDVNPKLTDDRAYARRVRARGAGDPERWTRTLPGQDRRLAALAL